MQQVWLALIGGFIAGWLVEWWVDWLYWRKNLEMLRQENNELRERVEHAQQELAELRKVAAAATATGAPDAVNPPEAENIHAEGE